jgi:uncharacterized protein (TIGR00369 family)
VTAVPIEYDGADHTWTASDLEIVEHAADKLARLAPHYDGIEFMRAIKRGELPVPPIAGLIGFDIREIAPGHVTFTLTPELEHYNPIGTVHGGVAATLLDTVMGCAVQTLLRKGEGYTTLDLSVRYLRSITVQTGPVISTGSVVHRGRRTATAAGDVVAADTGKVLATATSTLMLVRS